VPATPDAAWQQDRRLRHPATEAIDLHKAFPIDPLWANHNEEPLSSSLGPGKHERGHFAP
jgi:hypothetical protein